ncbi:MAG: 1-deoxy-D-xylulose-5-phosphate synthase [Armatimonadetes bacterium]|nr:1-deoxy-D-xylulose-5-phosphate synthase [Armatimonadota bacterium]
MNPNDYILNRINCPADLKTLSETERKGLAEEVRAVIIDTVSRTGGHLASNLGAVELSIALHTVFESPADKIVWDVSHQTYTHKLLTGRRDAFSSLRQGGGLSGFTRRDESEHDAFGAGHASTSISAALGLAKARELRGRDEHVVAVIGDGSMTGGLALEGLNNAEQLNTDLIVILNDNTMSISENVGALALHLSKLRLAPLYQRVETRAREMAQRIPAAKALARTAEGLSHGVTRLLASEAGAVFEGMGFTYLGPIDGHSTEVLIDVLESAKKLSGPLLIHIVTQKGKGYEFAESNSRMFHGISGFDVSDGIIERSNGNTSYTKVFSDTLVELAAEDERIVAITAAMPDGTGLSKFAEAYPDRFFDVGIAEEYAVTFAAGLAAGGLRPVVALYSTFLQRAYDQVLHDVCLQNLPVIFAIDRAGLVGEDGPTHHGVFDLSFLRHAPGLVVAAPKDTVELRNLISTALRHDGPMAVRYPRGGGPCPYECSKPEILAIGQGERLLEGDDVAIIALGSTVYPAVQAACSLRQIGISTEVVNARFVKPLDENLILDVLSKGVPTIVIEDNTIVGGFGSAILELASKNGCNANSIKLVGVPDSFVEHDSLDNLREKTGLSSSRIVEAATELIKTGLHPASIPVVQTERAKA